VRKYSNAALLVYDKGWLENLSSRELRSSIHSV
jgi:hypothetical protein